MSLIMEYNGVGGEFPNSSNTLDPDNHLNRKRKNKRKKKKNKQQTSKGLFQSWSQNRNLTMASWAETYTKVATWRFKHEISFWKARARALEYENGLLHDIIRSQHVGASTLNNNVSNSSSEEEFAESDQDENKDCENVEVSEEFIEFLTANAKYREEARLEKERMRGSSSETQLEATKKMEEPPSKNKEDSESHKKLYGECWKKIVALEMSLQSQFMKNCDKYKPNYWPNIPLNLKFS